MDELRLAVHITEQSTDDHDQQLFSGLDKVRTALNGDTPGFRELEKLDFPITVTVYSIPALGSPY